MSKILGHINLQNDVLVINYVDTEDEKVDERAIVIQWKKNPTLIRLMSSFYEILGKYLLEGNGNLDNLSKEQMDELFKRLLADDGTPPPK